LSTGAAAATLGVAAPASSFHAGNLFDKPPGAGGGGGLFYVGSPRERGWTCTACHQDPPHAMRVSVRADPPEVLQQGAYVPESIVRFTFELQSETKGRSSPLSNYNSLVAAILDTEAAAAGAVSGFAAEDFFTRGSSILASAGRTPNEIVWSFDWTAPAAGSGPVTIYAAVVDGNGAGSAPTVTLTDPFDDDVWVGRTTLEERSTEARGVTQAVRRLRTAARVRQPAQTSLPLLGWTLVAGAFVIALRKRG
jgi:hypothetical protein